VKEITGEDYKLHNITTLENFAAFIRKQRAENPASENELYAKFQQGQYMYSMFTTQHSKLLNDRYKGILWTDSITFFRTFLKQK
jgi:hypothetical protein